MSFSVQGLLNNMKGTPLQSELLERGIHIVEIVACSFRVSEKGNPMLCPVVVDPTITNSDAIRDYLMFPNDGDDETRVFKNTQRLAQFCATFGVNDAEFVAIVNAGADGYEPIKGRRGPVNVSVGKDRESGMPINKIVSYGAHSGASEKGSKRNAPSKADFVDEEVEA